MKKAISIRSRMSEFRKALQSGIDGIVEASRIYVEALDDNPRNADKFRSSFEDWVPHGTWAQFEAIGRKWMHPRLIMGGLSDSRKNTVIKRLPYSIQARIFDRERFEILLEDESVVSLTLFDADFNQVRQVCGDSIRSIEEQSIWHKGEKAKRLVENSEILSYTIIGGQVVFRRNTTMTEAEVERLLTQLKS